MKRRRGAAKWRRMRLDALAGALGEFEKTLEASREGRYACSIGSYGSGLGRTPS